MSGYKDWTCIPEMDVQGEEDVPHAKETQMVKRGEGDIEEEVPALQVLNIDELLGKILELKILLDQYQSLLDQSHGDNESMHAYLE